MGVLMRDYHTTQVPSAKKGVSHDTRRSELAKKEELNTILSSRDYRCDAVYTVAITVVKDAPYSVEQIAAALQKPVFTLYLGRKSCPLAMPIHPLIIKAETLRDALMTVPPIAELSDITSKTTTNVYWETNIASGIALQHVITRRDEPRSRKRWQFSDRLENYGVFKKEE